MRTIEFYLNVFYYCFYRVEYKRYLLVNKVNPIRFLLKVPLIRKRLEKKGVLDFEGEMNKIWGDKIYGFSITIAGGMLWSGMGIFFYSVFFMLDLFQYHSKPYPYLWACAIVSYVICYYFVFKDDNYLNYFDEFQKWKNIEKMKYGILTFSIFFGGILFFIFSLIFLPKE